MKKFKGEFTTADGSSVAPKDESVDAMDEDEEDRESVKVNRPNAVRIAPATRARRPAAAG